MKHLKGVRGGGCQGRNPSEWRAKPLQAALPSSCLGFRCFRAPLLLPDPEEPRAIPKLHPPEQLTSIATHPIQPPALDGNYVVHCFPSQPSS